MFCRPEEVRPCQFSELHRKAGDFTKAWNPNDPDSVQDALNWFNQMKEKKYTFFRVNTSGEAEQITTFDPNDKQLLFHSEIVVSPAYTGG